MMKLLCKIGLHVWTLKLMDRRMKLPFKRANGQILNQCSRCEVEQWSLPTGESSDG